MATGVASWSQTAATNASADSTVNWAEGQAPSTVNDSARAMMASVAKWRDDLGGVTSTSGTSTAYVATTNQSFASLAALSGKRITVQVHTASGPAATLAVDGLTAKAILRSGSTAVGTGDMQPATPYDVLYNVGTDKYYVLGSLGANAAFVAGTAVVFYQTAAPTGWTKSTTNNDKALRVVSGSGGVAGGTTAFTSVFAARTIARANLPNTDFMADGAGNIPVVSDTAGAGQAETTKTIVVASNATVSGGAGLSFAGANVPKIGGHIYLNGNLTQTTMDFATQYIDVIVCTKD